MVGYIAPTKVEVSIPLNSDGSWDRQQARFNLEGPIAPYLWEEDKTKFRQGEPGVVDCFGVVFERVGMGRGQVDGRNAIKITYVQQPSKR